MRINCCNTHQKGRKFKSISDMAKRLLLNSNFKIHQLTYWKKYLNIWKFDQLVHFDDWAYSGCALVVLLDVTWKQPELSITEWKLISASSTEHLRLILHCSCPDMIQNQPPKTALRGEVENFPLIIKKWDIFPFFSH